jgi:hypothetical protein
MATELPQQFVTFRLIQLLCEKLNYKPNEVYELNYIGYLNWILYFSTETEIQNNKK